MPVPPISELSIANKCIKLYSTVVRHFWASRGVEFCTSQVVFVLHCHALMQVVSCFVAVLAVSQSAMLEVHHGY